MTPTTRRPPPPAGPSRSTIAKAAPTIATTPSAGGAVGTSISDTATVSGGYTPTGNVTFNLFDNPADTRTGTPLFTGPAALNAGWRHLGEFSATAVGTVHWMATYNGDGNNASVTSGRTAEPVTISWAPRPRPR